VGGGGFSFVFFFFFFFFLKEGGRWGSLPVWFFFLGLGLGLGGGLDGVEVELAYIGWVLGWWCLRWDDCQMAL
jgi:hypothetical protein